MFHFAFKMQENVSNFKKFSPAAPTGTASTKSLIRKVEFFK